MDKYILVRWPKVQDMMEESWFRSECYLLQAFDDQEHIDSAYFVPEERYNQFKTPLYDRLKSIREEKDQMVERGVLK